MTIDYTKVGEQMSKSAPVHLAEDKKTYTKTSDISPVSKKSAKIKINKWGFIAGWLFFLYFIPALTIILSIVVWRNKKLKPIIESILSGKDSGPAILDSLKNISGSLPPEETQALKKRFDELKQKNQIGKHSGK